MKTFFQILSLVHVGVVLLLLSAIHPISAHGGLLAQWHFDESSGTSAFDSAGKFHGALSPAGAAFVSGGIAGNAISLDRSQDGWVSMSNVLALATEDFSIVLWVKTTATQDDTLALTKHEAFSENGYFVAIGVTGDGGSSGKASFVASEFVSSGVTSSTTVNDGNWHQVVGVYHAGGSELIYVDGAPAEATGASEPMVLNSAPFLIGGVNARGIASGRYTGFVDEVQIYDHPLTAADVDYLFQHPSQSVAPSLAITLTSTHAVDISWPSTLTGWNLQQNTDLTTTNWVPASETIMDNGTIKFILVVPPVANRFYRLAQP